MTSFVTHFPHLYLSPSLLYALLGLETTVAVANVMSNVSAQHMTGNEKQISISVYGGFFFFFLQII
jgi:hypothetical protein